MNQMKYKYGTIEYEIQDVLETMIRMDKAFVLFHRCLHNYNTPIACSTAKMLARNARSIFPELYMDRPQLLVDSTFNPKPRLHRA